MIHHNHCSTKDNQYDYELLRAYQLLVPYHRLSFLSSKDQLQNYARQELIEHIPWAPALCIIQVMRMVSSLRLVIMRSLRLVEATPSYRNDGAAIRKAWP